LEHDNQHESLKELSCIKDNDYLFGDGMDEDPLLFQTNEAELIVP
jgi:hypothetical protein